MRIAEYAVRNGSLTLLGSILLVAVGVGAWIDIPRAEDPSFPNTNFTVIAVYPGATQIDLEQLVVRPLEDAVKELDDLETIEASIEDGVAVLSIEFEASSDADEKFDEVLRQVNATRGDLPAELTSLEVEKFDTTNVAILQLALVSEEASYRRLDDLGEALRKRLEAVPGVKNAKTWALPERQVRVSLDLDRLAALRIPVGRVVEAIRGDNASLPGGAVELGRRRLNLKTSGNYASIEEVGRTPLDGNGAAVVSLRDVATIAWDYEDREYFGRYDGKRAIFVTATQREGQNIFRVREALMAQVEAFRGSLPGDVTLEVGFDQSVNVAHRLGALERDFLIAIGLVLVTLLPLGLRASGLVMVSIPLSLAIGLTLLHYTGFSLNQLSIVGFVIALGLLVDDSIVVVENIARFRRQGVPPVEAAIGATRQIGVAVVGTTATMLFAFLPLLALPETPGQYIRSLPVTVVYTVLASMVVALTIVPFLASRVLTGREDPEGNVFLRGIERVIHRTYRPLLHLAMRRRLATLGLAFALLAGSLALVPAIGFSLFPKAGMPQFLVRIEAPEGTSIGALDAIAREAEGRVLETPGIRSVMTSVGRGNPQIYYNVVPRSRKSNVAELFCSFERYDSEASPAVLQGLRDRLADVAGARILVKEFENGPPIEAPIAVRVLGEDLDGLARVAEEVAAILRDTPGTADVDNPLRVRKTDLRLRIDRDAAALLGVPLVEIDRMSRLAVAGLVVSRFRESDGDEYDIRLTVPHGERADLSGFRALQVPAVTGAYVPIRQVAALEFESTPVKIERRDRERAVTVTAEVEPGYNTDALTRQVRDAVDARGLPAGFRYELAGEYESRAESFGGLGTAILVAFFGIFGILVAEFKSFRGTLIVASVIPLGVIGGLVGLFLAGYTLSFTAMIGFVALIGIEIKNSILLVDFTNQLREQGVPLDEAIERAGEVRFLPVVLTTLTAVGALIPLVLEGSSLYSPLALVILGGLVSSLLLSRLVTPVMYSLIPPPGGESRV